MSEETRIKELQKFPTVFTFKIVGLNTDSFITPLKTIFDIADRQVNIESKLSTGDKYISFSVTTIVMDYEELENFYGQISGVEDLRFYV